MVFQRLRSRTTERSPLASAEFRAVIAVSLFIMFGFGLIVPTLPLFASHFGVRQAGIGLLLTVFAATRLAGDLVAGSLIDRYGERAMVATGAAIVGLSSIAAGGAGSYVWLVVLRGAGGIGSAFFLGALTVHLVGTVPPDLRGRAMSVFQAVIAIGLLLGPVVGGLLAAVAGLRAPLFAYGAICLASAPLCLRAMSRARVDPDVFDVAGPLEDPVTGPAPRAWARLRPLFRDSAYRAALVASATGFYVSGGIQTLIPDFWTRGHHAEGTVGVPFTVLSVASLAVIWHAGSVSDRRGRKVVLVPALVGTGVVAALMGLSNAVLPLLALMAVLGVTTGYARPGPTSIVADVAPPDARGVAVSGYRTAADIGGLVGPILVGVVAQAFGYRPAFLAVGAFAVAAGALAFTARETAPNRTVPEPAHA